MSVDIRVGLTEASVAVIRDTQKAPDRIVLFVGRRLTQALTEIESHVKVHHLRGGNWRVPRRGQTPLALRTGHLAQSVTSKLDQPLSGFVGSTGGPAAKYARTMLDDKLVRITPKKAKSLTVPIGKNYGPSGVPKFPTVRSAGPNVRFFTSKKGNRIVFLATGGRFKRGPKKGQEKGYPIFVLKDHVDVQGSGALPKGAAEKSERTRYLIGLGLREGIEGRREAGL